MEQLDEVTPFLLHDNDAFDEDGTSGNLKLLFHCSVYFLGRF